MSKNKGRTSVQVDVEEFEVAAPAFNLATDESPIIDRAVFKSNLGFWWDCLAGLVFLQSLLSIFLSGSKLLEHSDVAFGLIIVLLSVATAIITGRYAGTETNERKVFGFVLIALGLVAGVLAILAGSLPNSSPLTYAAIGLTLAGWSLRRLLGESSVRCVSLGLVAGLPLLFLEHSSYIGEQFAVVRSFLEYIAYWMTGVVADLNQVAFSPLDKGIRFASGELQSIAAFDNIAGVLVAISTSLAISVLGRQSFISALLSAIAAFMWWGVIRAGYCVEMAASKTLDGPLSELAMPILTLIGLFLLIAATNICFGTLMKAIEIDPGVFEVSPLTQIYNAFVSFPQLGPSPPLVINETLKEAPPKKEELIMDEYLRAKQASKAALAPHSSSSHSDLNPNE